MILLLKAIPVLLSFNLNSVVREITTGASFPSASFPGTTLRSSSSTVPSNLAMSLFSSEIFPAIPPTWNVRRVSCVPGSPMDCAAITPTDSPIWTILPLARFRP